MDDPEIVILLLKESDRFQFVGTPLIDEIDGIALQDNITDKIPGYEEDSITMESSPEFEITPNLGLDCQRICPNAMVQIA